jgi:hypothetical protein
MYAPLTFARSAAVDPGVTVVATTLRNYYARYAADSTEKRAHLIMEPLAALTRDNASDMYLRDVYVDTASDLPVRVTYTGRDDVNFAVDYAVVQDHWSVSHASYSRAFFGPFRIGRVSVNVDVVLDSIMFPNTPHDAQLTTAPISAPTPGPSKRSRVTLPPSGS